MKLSIISINRNNAIGLRRTIESVLEQTFTDYEYIIIDGASTDKSIEVINEFCLKRQTLILPQIKWLSEPDNGIYNAMNKGIRMAKGEYLLFLNSGDYLYENTVLSDIFIRNFSEDIIYGNLEMKKENGSRIKLFPSNLTFSWLYYEFLGHSSTLIKRDLFESFGYYNEKNLIVSDWEFFLKVLVKEQVSYRHVNNVISTLIEGGISNNPDYHEQVVYERKQIIERDFKLFVQDYQKFNDWEENRFIKKLKRFVKKIKIIK